MICQKRTKHPKSVRNITKAVQKHSGTDLLAYKKENVYPESRKNM